MTLIYYYVWNWLIWGMYDIVCTMYTSIIIIDSQTPCLSWYDNFYYQNISYRLMRDMIHSVLCAYLCWLTVVCFLTFPLLLFAKMVGTTQSSIQKFLLLHQWHYWHHLLLYIFQYLSHYIYMDFCFDNWYANISRFFWEVYIFLISLSFIIILTIWHVYMTYGMSWIELLMG